jgi:hypothetical protein
MNNKHKVIVNIELLKPYLSFNLPALLSLPDSEVTLPKQISPIEILVQLTNVSATELPSVELSSSVYDNKSVFPQMPALPPPPVKHKRPWPPGPGPPTPISKNIGGICTQSQATKQRSQEKIKL